MKLLAKRIAEKRERSLWERWLALYPYMVVPDTQMAIATRKPAKPPLKYTPFEDFTQSTKKPTVSDEHILAVGMTVLRKVRKKHGTV